MVVVPIPEEVAVASPHAELLCCVNSYLRLVSLEMSRCSVSLQIEMVTMSRMVEGS